MKKSLKNLKFESRQNLSMDPGWKSPGQNPTVNYINVNTTKGLIFIYIKLKW